jgi:hypothetical protein
MPAPAKPITFTTTLELHGKTATGFEVPATAVQALGGGKRPPVRVMIGPYAYRSTVATMSGCYMLPLAAEHRTAAGVAAGETIQVTLELDTAERTVDIPPELASAMRKAAGTRTAFDRLSYTNRKEMVLSVLGAKQEETRRRRIAKAIAQLRALPPKRTT